MLAEIAGLLWALLLIVVVLALASAFTRVVAGRYRPRPGLPQTG